jgi:hypothetical protein
MERFQEAIDQELEGARAGGGVFKAVRGEYGSGKAFFARWLQERAKKLTFATAEVQISRDRDAFAPAGNRVQAAHRAAIDG